MLSIFFRVHRGLEIFLGYYNYGQGESEILNLILLFKWVLLFCIVRLWSTLATIPCIPKSICSLSLFLYMFLAKIIHYFQGIYFLHHRPLFFPIIVRWVDISLYELIFWSSFFIWFCQFFRMLKYLVSLKTCVSLIILFIRITFFLVKMMISINKICWGRKNIPALSLWILL